MGSAPNTQKAPNILCSAVDDVIWKITQWIILGAGKTPSQVTNFTWKKEILTGKLISLLS